MKTIITLVQKDGVYVSSYRVMNDVQADSFKAVYPDFTGLFIMEGELSQEEAFGAVLKHLKGSGLVEVPVVKEEKVVEVKEE
jgi:hypothetical protein